jgi:hypothetical protein
MEDKRGKKKTKKFLKVGIITSILIIPLNLLLDLKLSLIVLLSLLLLEAYLIWKEKIGKEVVIAFLLALIITSYYSYQYTTSNILIGRINLFPLISWTFGLVLIREIYERINHKNKLLITNLIYWSILLSLEYFFYNLLNIRLDSSYPGLFGLDLMHAQTGMKFFYIFAGPFYLLLTDYLKLK